MSEGFPPLDLLGDPVPEGFGKRGRPAHVVSDEKRKLVIMLQAFDWKDEKIAAALGITPPTLRKHYFRELKARAEARARVEAKLIDSLMAEVGAGNVSAIDKMFKRLDRLDLARLPKVEKEPKLGKKETAKREAREAPGSSWGELIN